MIFSTDPDPKKSKTKCLHFTKNKRMVAQVTLYGTALPWVYKANYLGNSLSVKLNTSPISVDTTSDILQKNAIFFDRVLQLIQK